MPRVQESTSELRVSWKGRWRPAKPISSRFSDRGEDFLPLQDELAFAEELIDALPDDDFQLAGYEDTYEAKLRALIDAELAGEGIVAPPHAEQLPRVINLHDARRQSSARARSAQTRRPSRVGGLGVVQKYRT